MKRSDQELVKAASAGDIESFRILYERHYKTLVALAYGRLPDWHLAEDAAQSAFAVACRELSSLKDPSKFVQWIGTICRRIAGKSNRKSNLTNDSILDKIAQPEQVENENQELWEMIQRLEPLQREAITLRYFSELSYDEIAELIGSTRAGVHGLLQRARRNLAGELGNQ